MKTASEYAKEVARQLPDACPTCRACVEAAIREYGEQVKESAKKVADDLVREVDHGSRPADAYDHYAQGQDAAAREIARRIREMRIE